MSNFSTGEIIRAILYMHPPVFEGSRFYNFNFMPYNPCYGSSSLRYRNLINYFNSIYNGHSVTAIGPLALTPSQFADLDGFRAQFTELLTVCIIDGDFGVTESLLAHAPIQEVNLFAKLMYLICTNRGTARNRGNWQHLSRARLLEFYKSLSPIIKHINSRGPDGFDSSAEGMRKYWRRLSSMNKRTSSYLRSHRHCNPSIHSVLYNYYYNTVGQHSNINEFHNFIIECKGKLDLHL